MTIEPATMDPAMVTEGGTGGLLQNIYEGLVTFDAQNRVAPQLAAKWEVSPDGRTYTFHLRPGARFHNGQPATAADVKYSLERALWPDTRSSSAANYLPGVLGVRDVAAGRRRDLPGVRVADAHTVVITMDKPRGYFLSALTYPSNWVVCKEAIQKNGGMLDEQAAVGTGPFRLAEYHHAAKATMEASPEYDGPKPLLRRIERRIVLDPQTRHLMYENGETDLNSETTLDAQRDQQDPKLKSQLLLLPAASVNYLCMHPRLQPAFRDVRVRRAFAEALDREDIVRVASHGLWTRADSMLPPAIAGAAPDSERIPHDPVDARKLLATAGYPGGKRFPQLTLVYTQNIPERSATAQLIRSQLQKELGISVSLQEREAATFIADRRAEKLPFYLGVWDSDYPDPQNILSTLLRTGASLNNFGYSNAQFDALCDRADGETNPARRLPLYRQADEIAMRDVALLPLYYPTGAVLVKPYVHGLEYNVLGILPHTRTRIVVSSQ